MPVVVVRPGAARSYLRRADVREFADDRTQTERLCALLNRARWLKEKVIANAASPSSLIVQELDAVVWAVEMLFGAAVVEKFVGAGYQSPPQPSAKEKPCTSTE
jgi:tRNA U55 pseudouridine synthase TruB